MTGQSDLAVAGLAVSSGDDVPVMAGTRQDAALTRLESELRRRLPVLLSEVRDLLSKEWPDYARFIDTSGAQVAEAGGLFVHRLLEVARHGPDQAGSTVSAPDLAADTIDMVFEQIGRMQWGRGRELTELLTAYQVGARAAWRQVSGTALTLGLPPELLATLAEAVFVFVNQLSSASAHGYVLEQSESSAARERLRGELSDLLLSDQADLLALQHAATSAGWALPERAAVILIDPADDRARAVVERLDSRFLPVRRPRLFGAIVPDPAGGSFRDRATRVLHGAHAVVGHPVALTLLPASTAIAQLAMDLQRRGLLDGDPIFASEHLDMIIAHRDERLMSALRRQVLEPLAPLTEARRAQLAQTLAAWLRHMGDRHAVAAELHIHPQTVRYRIAQLRELFGDELDSPRTRAKLFLALAFGADGT